MGNRLVFLRVLVRYSIAIALVCVVSANLSSCGYIGNDGMKPRLSQPLKQLPEGEDNFAQPTPHPAPHPTPEIEPEPTPAEKFELSQATVFNSPSDVANWPVTTTIDQIDFREDGIHLEFSKLEGTNRWPDVTPPGWEGPLQYTLWLALKINGRWYTSGIIQYWYGLDASGGNVMQDNQIATNWVYDSRWGPMMGYQPRAGEAVGFFVTSGNQRNALGAGDAIVMERSNVIVVPFPESPTSFSF